MKTFFGWLAVGFVIVSLSFVPYWHRHSENVKDIITAQMSTIQSETVDWSTVKYDDPKLHTYTHDSILSMMQVMNLEFMLPFGYAYKEALYDLVAGITNTHKKEVMEDHIRKVAKAQADYYATVTKLDNKLFLMLQTF